MHKLSVMFCLASFMSDASSLDRRRLTTSCNRRRTSRMFSMLRNERSQSAALSPQSTTDTLIHAQDIIITMTAMHLATVNVIITRSCSVTNYNHLSAQTLLWHSDAKWTSCEVCSDTDTSSPPDLSADDIDTQYVNTERYAETQTHQTDHANKHTMSHTYCQLFSALVLFTNICCHLLQLQLHSHLVN